MKLVLVLVLLIFSIMSVVGTFLINSVSNFYLEDFQQQIGDVFKTEFVKELEGVAHGSDAIEKLHEKLAVHEGDMGIDSYRSYSILNSVGVYQIGSNDTFGANLTITPNIIAAMAGRLGDSGSMADSQMDVAIPIAGDQRYIIYINDNKSDIQELSWRFFAIVMQAMLFGLIVAVLLSFLLSKTITNPIENITKRAARVAAGDFSEPIPIQSSDEIGELTHTFNKMAGVLHDTLEQIQDERDKLNTLFLHMADGVTAFTNEGKIIHMNPATERLLGVSFHEDMRFDDVFHGMKLPKSQDVEKKEYICSTVGRFGRTLNVLFVPYGATENDGGIMAVIHDVTEQKKLDEARREFVANVSHELRTPLTNIKSYTETLMDAAGELSAEMEVKFLGIISGEADRMTRLVKDLLTLSKLDYGRTDLKFTRFSMTEMLESVYAAMQLTAENRGNQLKITLQEPLPEMIGDRERLEQVVVNILSNSIKYTPSGGHIHLTAAKRDNRYMMIRVEDDGIGIPKEDIPRLFERFYRVDKARSRDKGGSGLGLAIAKDMVEAHKGTIHLESVVDFGTTVTIILPIDLQIDEEKTL